MEMTPERWQYTNQYLRAMFGSADAHLNELMSRATDHGIPDIAITPEVGRLLKVLVSMTQGRLAIEVGTLAGYSAIWMARGLAEDGKLITIESEPKHAEFAEQAFKDAGVSERVDLIRGLGLDVLKKLATSLDPGSVDVVFLDAVKTEYTEYFRAVRPLIAIGGLLIADNVLGSSAWWIDQEDNESRNGVDEFNRALAADSSFEATAFPFREGLLVARRMS